MNVDVMHVLSGISRTETPLYVADCARREGCGAVDKLNFSLVIVAFGYRESHSLSNAAFDNREVGTGIGEAANGTSVDEPENALPRGGFFSWCIDEQHLSSDMIRDLYNVFYDSMDVLRQGSGGFEELAT
jgi:hypothetical protein